MSTTIGYTNKNDVPRTSKRGKHTRNPGWESGNHWVSCDLCGCDIRSADAMQTWDHKIVCPDDWEPRHEQDFVRSRLDNPAAQGLVRPSPPEDYIFATGTVCTTNNSLAGTAQAGCAIVGIITLGFMAQGFTAYPIPQATFN